MFESKTDQASQGPPLPETLMARNKGRFAGRLSRDQQASSAIRQLNIVSRFGLPRVYHRAPATSPASDFLYDLWADLPWTETDLRQAELAMRSAPAFPAIRQRFQDRFGIDFWAGVEEEWAKEDASS